MHTKINFTGIFSHYQPINFEPYYVFTSDNKFLIKCRDYPELMSHLSPQDLVNIEAELGKKDNCGTHLVNVKFGRLSNE